MPNMTYDAIVKADFMTTAFKDKIIREDYPNRVKDWENTKEYQNWEVRPFNIAYTDIITNEALSDEEKWIKIKRAGYDFIGKFGEAAIRRDIEQVWPGVIKGEQPLDVDAFLQQGLGTPGATNVSTKIPSPYDPYDVPGEEAPPVRHEIVDGYRYEVRAGQPLIDPTTGQPYINPATGQPYPVQETWTMIGPVEKPTEMGTYKTYDEAATAAPENYIPSQDPGTGQWYLKYQAPKGEARPEGLWTTYSEAVAAAPAGYYPVQLGSGYWGLEKEEKEEGLTEFQKQQMALWGREQSFTEAEAKRQYESQLAARGPGSWIEMAAYKDQIPAIQPFMKDLGFQGQVGQPIPGTYYGAAVPGAGGTSPLFPLPASEQRYPALTAPSSQLQTQWGPTKTQKYTGYLQAQSGQLPEETLWRMGARRPAGSYRGLSQTR